MSKYDLLWEYVQKSGASSFTLTFEEIEKIAGVPIDHSFLTYKKELLACGYQVEKISMKKQTVIFRKIEDSNLEKERKNGGVNQMEVRIIDSKHSTDINIKNEPFTLFGRMIPSYTNEIWDYTTELFEESTEMCFPDENYDYDAMKANSTFIGAYDGEKCIGLAIMQEQFFKYMYLYDLKVNRDYREKGVASALLKKAGEIAAEKHYHGIFTQGQDNNLGACLFYVKNNFAIGGLNTKVYQGTPQEDKKDIYFYLDF